MPFGIMENFLLAASAVSAVAGAGAAIGRRRAGALMILNAIFALVFAYFAVLGFRFGSPYAIGLCLVATANAAVAWAIVGRAAPKAPVA